VAGVRLIPLRSRLLSQGLSVQDLFMFAVINADRGGNHVVESGSEWFLVYQSVFDVVFEVGSVIRQERTISPADGDKEPCDTLEFCGIGSDCTGLAECSKFSFHCAS
jgi:hypothetical protein